MSAVAFAEFGPLVVATDIDDAVMGLVRKWINTYLSEFELERDLGDQSLKRPRPANIINALTVPEFKDNALPAIVVNTASTSSTPIVMAGGDTTAFWRATITCRVRGKTPPETKVLAATFEGCVRRLMVQRAQKEHGLITDCRWDSTLIQPAPDTTGAGRWLADGIAQFVLGVDVAMNGVVGPSVPDAGPYAPLATVQEIDVDLETMNGDDS